MKAPVLVLGTLLLAVLVAPAGHSAHHRHHRVLSSHDLYTRHLLPLRILRTSQPPKVVRAVSPTGVQE